MYFCSNFELKAKHGEAWTGTVSLFIKLYQCIINKCGLHKIYKLQKNINDWFQFLTIANNAMD